MTIPKDNEPQCPESEDSFDEAGETHAEVSQTPDIEEQTEVVEDSQVEDADSSSEDAELSEVEVASEQVDVSNEPEEVVEVLERRVSPSPIPILSTPPADPLAPIEDNSPNLDWYEDEAPQGVPDSTEGEAAADAPVAENAETEAEADDVPETGATEASAQVTVEPDSDETHVFEAIASDDTREFEPVAGDDDTHVIEPVSGDDDTHVFGRVTDSDDTAVLTPTLPDSAGQNSACPTPDTENQSVPSSSAAVKKPSVSKPSPSSKKQSNSSLSDFESEPERKRSAGKVAAGVLGTVLVLAGAYAGAQWAFSDSIAKGTTVAGVDVGGKSESEAAALLDDKLTSSLSKKMALTAGDLETSIVPADAGVALDSAGTVAGLTGFTLDPVYLWEHLTGGREVQPLLHVDDAKFTATLDSIASSLLVEPVDGTVAFVDGEAVATDAKDGSGVDIKEAQARIVDNLFTTVRPVALSSIATVPTITQEITDSYLEQAQQIASGPVTVKVDGQTAEIPVDIFTKDISVEVEGTTMNFAYNGKDLSKEIVKRTTNLLTDAKDARFVFEGGKPVIKAGKAGTTIDEEELVAEFAKAASSETRTAEIKLVEFESEDSVESLKKLGIKEKVASFSTPVPYAPPRTENLRVAAERVTGTLVKPGEEFNLIEVIGPISAANGYHNSGVIVNGVHTEGMGGGLSQMSTTAYNAGFFAGMTDIAHRPHTVWFNRYPMGRESTLYSGSIDMIWRNDSSTGILMRSYISNNQLVVEAWGTKTYEVTTTTSPKRNIVAATTTTSTAANCEAYPKGNDGFNVTVTRKVKEIATGKIVKDEAKSWTYRPDNGVICKKPEAAADKASKSDE